MPSPMDLWVHTQTQVDEAIMRRLRSRLALATRFQSKPAPRVTIPIRGAA